MNLEKVSYREAREWFWIRTFIWLVPACIASAFLVFEFAGYYELVERTELRAWIAVGIGVGAVLLGLLGAKISLESPWMRRGWRLAFLLNGPAGAVLSAVAAFLVAGAMLAYLQSDPRHALPFQVGNAAYMLTAFGIGCAGMWGFIFGSWFAMRRDKYFVEQI
ncbi:MAG: hypothetical protein ABFD54_11195 [Armatimonadota bacterium]|nr:hypothetical protein [bacterium]